MSGRRDSLQRRKPQLTPKPRLLLICEGTVTEYEYFKGLAAAEEVRRVDITIDREGGVPKTLVERAVARRKDANKKAKRANDETLRYDEIWCIFDVDEHPKLVDAQQQADAHGIKIALSNPCFELWLLLHFRDHRAFIHRDDVHHACTEVLKGYKKSIDFDTLSPLVVDAVKRAVALEEWQETRGMRGENPSTTVHELVERLRELGKSESLRMIQSLRPNYRSH